MSESKQIKDNVSHSVSKFEEKLVDTNDKKKLTRMRRQFPNQTWMGERSQHAVPKELMSKR
jgi:hypothetical protein